MSTKHPARNVRQMVGAASVAAFVGAGIPIATNGHNGTTQPAGAAQTPTTQAPASGPSSAQQQVPDFDNDGGGWGATPPDNGQWGNDQWGNGQSSNGQSNSSGGSFQPPAHSQSGGS